MLSTPRPRLGAARDLVFCWLRRPPSSPIRQDEAERRDHDDRQTDAWTCFRHYIIGTTNIPIFESEETEDVEDWREMEV